ncbi:MAG: hypothetical protein QOF55_1428, partial [Thermoleophilaceae bacterium]|nr:hypothetical protein [Thermoleophilaceae bacterium]
LSVGGGTLRGGGTVVAPSGVSNSGGTVHPGHSPGTLSITGDYTQTSGGTLAVDVTGTTAGTGYSQLAVSGTATLAGALAVTTSSPQTGTLKIVSAGALTGTFSPVSFTGQTDSVGYDATSVTLSATVSPPPPPPPDPPANTAAPSVSGTTTVGSVLSATQGSWSGSPTSYAYQWRNCDVTGGACADIAGAVGSSYQLSAPDAGHTIRVVVTATGAGGSSAAASGQTGVVTPPPDTTAPVVQAFSASPSTFAVNPAGAPETAVSAKAKRGTTFSYGLSEAARGVFTIERRDVGRRAGAKCVKATHKNRGKKKCTRYTLSGRFAVASSAGKNHHAFSGRIGSKKLTPGSYRVTLVASDPAGNTSAAARTTVTVVSK